MLPFWSPGRQKRRKTAVNSGFYPKKGRGSELPGLFQQLLADLAEIADGVRRFVELGLLLGIHFDLDDPLDALGTDHDRNADIEAVHAVLAGEIGGAGQNALFVE